jgi:hypothetical protein
MKDIDNEIPSVLGMIFAALLGLLLFVVVIYYTAFPDDQPLGNQYVFPEGWQPVAYISNGGVWVCLKDDEYRACNPIEVQR